MEVNPTELEKCIELRDFKGACDILKGLPEKSLSKHIPIIKIIIENGKYIDSLDAMEVLVKLSKINKKAYGSLLRYLSSEDCFVAAQNMERHFSYKEVKDIPFEILSNLIRHPNRHVRSSIFGLIRKISHENPKQTQEIISADRLFETYIRGCETSSNRKEILEIAKIIIPFKPQEYMTLHTLSLINWIRERESISACEINELFDEIQRKFLAKAHSFVYKQLSTINTLMVNARDSDKLAALSLQRYREHKIHQFNVGVLGLFLLGIYISPSETLKEHISNLKDWPSGDIEKAWLIAAFLHDHARPIKFMLEQAPTIRRQKLQSYSNQKHTNNLLRVLEPIKRQVFSIDLRNIYEGLLEGKNELEDLQEFLSEELDKIEFSHKVTRDEILDHGILAAVNLTTTLRDNNAYIENCDIAKASVRAVATHNLPFKVDLEKEPISFLLVLCDEIQEFEREITKKTISTRIGRFACKNEKIFFEKKLSVVFECPSREELAIGWDNGKYESSVLKKQDRFCFSNTDINPQQVEFTPLKPGDQRARKH